MAGKTRIGEMKQTRGYIQNVFNEYKQWMNSDSSGPSPEAGQFWGAVFGRQYNRKGRRIK